MVSLNDKVRVLVDTIELHAMAEKKLPVMAKAMLRPACTTLRTLLLVTPEEELQRHVAKMHLLHEAIVDCSHNTEQEFIQHITELFKAWN